MTEPSRVHYLCKWELQQLFNRLQFQERVQAGELRWLLIFHRPLTKSLNPYTPGAKFERFAYIDVATNNTVAQAHWVRNPDGSIAYSGKPDPDWLIAGTIVYQHSKAREEGQISGLWCEDTTKIWSTKR